MNKTLTLVVCGIAFVAVLAGVVVLNLAGKDTSVFIGFATSAAIFLIPQLLQSQKSQDIHSDVQQIKMQTNGPLTRMQQQIDQMNQIITELKGGNNAGLS